MLSAPTIKVILKTGELAPALAATSTPLPAQASSLADPTDWSKPPGLNTVLIGGAMGGKLEALLIVGLAWQLCVRVGRLHLDPKSRSKM